MIGMTREPACVLTFPMTCETGQSEDITVQRYFLQKYKRQLMYVNRGVFKNLSVTILLHLVGGIPSQPVC